METVKQKFLRYVAVDTPSDENNFDITPSTACQKNLARLLKSELEELGLQATMTDNGYVYAHIPANCDDARAVGFIAHLDVVAQPKGYGVKPVVHENYDGGELLGGKLSPKEFPQLAKCVGEDIITSDGTTILGADDKAGVAEIMTLAEYLIAHPEIKHGKVGIAFTPDEEIGHGARLFDVKAFGCDGAYTVDGETLGEISYETFNGAAFTITVEGVNIHPGQAKGKMINAVICAQEIIAMLPADQRPETTEGREGYFFVSDIAGNVEKCVISGIIRDHDRAEFERRKDRLKAIIEAYTRSNRAKATLTLRDQYYNCAEVIQPAFYLVDNAKKAMTDEGVQPIIEPIRGGTDGSSLSFMGLPCPNLCTGGQNAHGLNEWISVQAMEKTVAILVRLVKSFAE